MKVKNLAKGARILNVFVSEDEKAVDKNGNRLVDQIMVEPKKSVDNVNLVPSPLLDGMIRSGELEVEGYEPEELPGEEAFTEDADAEAARVAANAGGNKNSKKKGKR